MGKWYSYSLRLRYHAAITEGDGKTYGLEAGVQSNFQL